MEVSGWTTEELLTVMRWLDEEHADLQQAFDKAQSKHWTHSMHNISGKMDYVEISRDAVNRKLAALAAGSNNGR